MAFIEPMHRNKPNITYLLSRVVCPFTDFRLDHKRQHVRSTVKVRLICSRVT